MQELKPVARISKSKLKDILDIFKTSTKKVEKIDSSACNSCAIKNNPSFDTNKLNEFCLDCPKLKSIAEFSYVTEKETEIGIIEIVTNENRRIALSKSAIKQYLAYHFIVSNKNYVRKSVSFASIADICNFSVVTARHNHNMLLQVGLVYSTEVKRGKFDIVIDGEYKNHLKKEDGGKGYITMSLDTLNHLLSFENVNELKLEIKKLLWADAKGSKLGKKIRFKKDNLISVLPPYILKSNKLTEAFLRGSKTLFDVSNDTIDTKRYETKETISKKYTEPIRIKILKFFDDTGCSLSSNYSKVLSQINLDKYNLFEEDLITKLELEKEIIVGDLVGLAVQYGENRVLAALDYMFNKYTIDEDDINYSEINNPGAFIRTLIVQSINKYGSLAIAI
ncbi:MULTISPECIES: hypothetical protein [unclassified Clostridioides]|uniref:hypothetical protein n=1 Tax=unclassified Clostridioides TaxID=2635829 RepID=UPI001D10ED83|nr:hypothetical protein [Clostridioides sp. ES-S-0049-03]MCC0678217.1 hypothetical protein [Clostridioides sp. ES-W-0018-02]MCC0713041.1 hypothetical protein [Clostridioides sp. ES-W-0017-02]